MRLVSADEHIWAPTYDVDPGKGWIMFASLMLALIGVLNVIYGIAAIDNATFYARDLKFVFGDLKTWGWMLTFVGRRARSSSPTASGRRPSGAAGAASCSPART